MENKNSFYKKLSNLSNVEKEKYQRQLNLIDYYRPFIDHTQPYQFDAYMTSFAEKLLAEHNVNLLVGK